MERDGETVLKRNSEIWGLQANYRAYDAVSSVRAPKDWRIERPVGEDGWVRKSLCSWAELQCSAQSSRLLLVPHANSDAGMKALSRWV